MSVLTLLRRSVLFLALMTTIVIAYTLVVTAAGKALFPFQAAGSIVTVGGKEYSLLLGQPFHEAHHLWGRPVSADTATYSKDGKPLFYAGPSNSSPATADYGARLAERTERMRRAHPARAGMPVPVELVTESGSGLDPHISPAAAEFQVERLASATGFTPDEVRRTIAMYTEGRSLGLLGEPRVHVLKVNLALDGLLPNGHIAAAAPVSTGSAAPQGR